MKNAAKSESKKSSKSTQIITKDNDYDRLWPTLREDWVHHDISSMTGLAIMSSTKPLMTDRYTPIEKAFCDGFEVRLGSLLKKDVVDRLDELIQSIHDKVPKFFTKNIKITERKDYTYAWITLKPENSAVNSSMLTKLVKTVKAIKDHFMITWDLDEDEIDVIQMTKLDIT